MATAKPKPTKVKVGPAPKVPPTTPLTPGLGEPRRPGTPYTLPRTLPGGPMGPGRPEKVGEYVITPKLDGIDMTDTQPDLIEQVQDSLKKFQLPQALQPKYLRRPQVMENGPTGRRNQIRSGFGKRITRGLNG